MAGVLNPDGKGHKEKLLTIQRSRSLRISKKEVTNTKVVHLKHLLGELAYRVLQQHTGERFSVLRLEVPALCSGCWQSGT